MVLYQYFPNIDFALPIYPYFIDGNLSTIGFIQVIGDLIRNIGLHRWDRKHDEQKYDKQEQGNDRTNDYVPKFFDTRLKF